ncbi:hypothetical protein DWX43_20705 [Clostridium sp. AF19-22AC]|jgi:hypothetical protein|uniref:hypothetical protein n=1 Tax=Clostridia TaxID=186801 RepID=UPI000E4A74B1|nr:MULTISPECIES: hypothetical protein [Clostridia]RHR22886.1 hypothetical protein DWX43_20705 [Clostridium sp. AF19-22AC]
MKKRGCIIILIGIFLIIITKLTPDYIIVTDRSTLSDTGKDVELNVVEYKIWLTEDAARKIAVEHARINGVPDSLVINMYHSRMCLKNGHKYKTIKVHYTDSDSRHKQL